jgi:hypothetical protein
MINTYKEPITKLSSNEIFVFGSNLSGRHGKGAALLAKNKFGAIYGVAEGLQGQSYAIPTKNEQLKTLSLGIINDKVNTFINFAIKNKQYIFLVTAIGTGLAGYKFEDIAPMFKPCMDIDNIKLPRSFLDCLIKNIKK